MITLQAKNISNYVVMTVPRKTQKREALDMLASKGLLTHNPSRNQILYSKLGHAPHTRMGAKRKTRRRNYKLKRRLKV
jgi:hypothetical protein